MTTDSAPPMPTDNPHWREAVEAGRDAIRSSVILETEDGDTIMLTFDTSEIAAEVLTAALPAIRRMILGEIRTEEIKALVGSKAQILCKIYFDIAARAVGEDEVIRQRDEAIAVHTEEGPDA